MQRYRAREIEKFLLKLRETDRDIFIRRYWYLDSIKEIAKRHGVTEGCIIPGNFITVTGIFTAQFLYCGFIPLPRIARGFAIDFFRKKHANKRVERRRKDVLGEMDELSFSYTVEEQMAEKELLEAIEKFLWKLKYCGFIPLPK